MQPSLISRQCIEQMTLRLEWEFWSIMQLNGFLQSSNWVSQISTLITEFLYALSISQFCWVIKCYSSTYNCRWCKPILANCLGKNVECFSLETYNFSHRRAVVSDFKNVPTKTDLVGNCCNLWLGVYPTYLEKGSKDFHCQGKWLDWLGLIVSNRIPNSLQRLSLLRCQLCCPPFQSWHPVL